MSTSGTLPPLAGPASPETASIPVAAAIVGGSAAALALVILLSWLTRREGAWGQRQARHAEREANLRREVRARHAAGNTTGTEVHPADLRPDLKRPTPFLVINPGSEMLFGLKEIIVDPTEKAAATPKGSIELGQCKPINASRQDNLGDHPAQGPGVEYSCSAVECDQSDHITECTAATSGPAVSADHALHALQEQPSLQCTLLSHRNPFWVPAQLSQHQSAVSSAASPR